MSTWRRKVIEAFPDLQRDIAQPNTSAMQVFFQLLPRVREAHARNDTAELKRIYDFARWCFEQNGTDLPNDAAVGFYEHLVDDGVTREQIPRWLSPKIFKACESLFEARMEHEDFVKLQNKYRLRGREFA
jgi:hypothetical protein